MFKKELLELHVGQCGGCGLEIRFWGTDGARLTCVKCGLEHEVQVDSALDLSSGEKTNVVMIVPVWGTENEGRVDVSQN